MHIFFQFLSVSFSFFQFLSSSFIFFHLLPSSSIFFHLLPSSSIFLFFPFFFLFPSAQNPLLGTVSGVNPIGSFFFLLFIFCFFLNFSFSFYFSITFHVFPLFLIFIFIPFFTLVFLFSFLGCSKSVAALQDSLGKSAHSELALFALYWLIVTYLCGIVRTLVMIRLRLVFGRRRVGQVNLRTRIGRRLSHSV